MSAEPQSDSGDRRVVDTWLDRYSVSRTEQILWMVVVLSMITDAALTTYGISMGLRELNPIARYAFDSMGVLGFLWLKGLAIGLAIFGWWITPTDHRDLIPATLATLWIGASALNAITLLVAT